MDRQETEMKTEKKPSSQQKVLCNWGTTLKQSSAVHIPALYSADGILPGIISKLRLLVINLASVPGRQLVNSPTAQSLERCVPCKKSQQFLNIGAWIWNYFCETTFIYRRFCFDKLVLLQAFFVAWLFVKLISVWLWPEFLKQYYVFQLFCILTKYFFLQQFFIA